MWNDPIEPCPNYAELFDDYDRLSDAFDACEEWGYRMETEATVAKYLAIAGWLAFALAIAALMITL